MSTLKEISLTEKQLWFLKCAIEAKSAVLPFDAIDDKIFTDNYRISKEEMEVEINALKIQIDSL